MLYLQAIQVIAQLWRHRVVVHSLRELDSDYLLCIYVYPQLRMFAHIFVFCTRTDFWLNIVPHQKSVHEREHLLRVFWIVSFSNSFILCTASTSKLTAEIWSKSCFVVKLQTNCWVCCRDVIFVAQFGQQWLDRTQKQV